MTWQQMVTDFHYRLGAPVGETPKLLTDERMRSRIGWIDEELGELEEAQEKRDLPGMADAIVDAMYFLIGTAVEMGVDLGPLFDAVHQANMAKLGGGHHPDGKIKKPYDWKAPDIAGKLRKQGWRP